MTCRYRPAGICKLVRARGLEPPRVAPQEPKSCASASSATPARKTASHHTKRYDIHAPRPAKNRVASGTSLWKTCATPARPRSSWVLGAVDPEPRRAVRTVSALDRLLTVYRALDLVGAGIPGVGTASGTLRPGALNNTFERNASVCCGPALRNGILGGQLHAIGAARGSCGRGGLTWRTLQRPSRSSLQRLGGARTAAAQHKTPEKQTAEQH